MAVPEQTPYIEHTGNGVATSFSLGFQCESKDHLIVLVDEIEPPIATWSLTGGNVVFTTAPASGSKITLQRNTPFSRTVDYQSYNNSFRPPAVNKDFDWIWLKLQELGVADWILSNRIDALKSYVNQQDGILQDNIDSLKNYVDDKDDELRNYLLNAIQEQGVALDQLEEYYSYLMQQLAQVAIDRGWAASFIVSADGSTQQEINDFGGAKWWNKPLGYDVGSTVKLENGDIVKSTEPNNTANPNVDMTGWVKVNDASQIFDASGKDQQQLNNQRPTVLQLAKVKGDGVTDDTVELQKVFRDADDNRRPYVFIPFHNNNYLINAPLVMQEPGAIHGDKGATYNGGIGKDGWILIGSGAEYAFNLGNERVYSATTQSVDTKQTRNWADNWEIKGIGIKGANGIAARTKTGIKHTARTNGPDRGMTIHGLSAYDLKHAVHITNQNLGTQLANLVIEGSCLSKCDIPVFAEGNILGFRFVGNQCEQNYSGAIHGTFNGGITIEDNMLEGQVNAINIYPTSFGNRPKIAIKRNYFEANSGDYVIKVKSTSGDSELDVGNNYYYNKLAADYILIDGGVWLVRNTDPWPITLNNATIKVGSDIFNGGVNFYKQRNISQNGDGGQVYTRDFLTMLPSSQDISAIFSAGYPSIDTPFGLIRYAEANNQYLTINTSVAAGDVFALNVLVSCDADFLDGTFQVFNPDYSAVVGQATAGDYFAQSAKGGMVLLTMTFKAAVPAANLRFRINSPTKTTGSRKIYGVSARNYGAYVTGGAKDIYPCMPKLNPVVGRVAAQADSTATDVAGLKNDLNALLTKLRNSGTMNP